MRSVSEEKIINEKIPKFKIFSLVEQFEENHLKKVETL